MESIIKWQTGEPKEEGRYLVTLNNNSVAYDSWVKCGIGWAYFPKSVIAWCKLSDIKPYKESIKSKKKCCGECKFYRKAELDPIMEKYCFDGVCIVEPPTLGTNSKSVSCDMFKPLQL